MKPLRVALFVKGTPSGFEREMRNMGWWSYPVPEFTWQHFNLAGGRNEARSRFQNYDLIFLEDLSGNAGILTGNGGPPVTYLSIDSTLSEKAYQDRLDKARMADLILVDHDQPSRFRINGRRAKRLDYCINDHVFKPLEKTLDMSFHCGSGSSRGQPGGTERVELRQYLHEIHIGHGYSFRSGAMGLPEYAESMGHSKVIINWPRVPGNRSHRVLDAMACRACLVTGTIPNIPEDKLERDMHYIAFDKKEELPYLLESLFAEDRWQEIADNGYKLVMENHTWAIRARELRELLEKELRL